MVKSTDLSLPFSTGLLFFGIEEMSLNTAFNRKISSREFLFLFAEKRKRLRGGERKRKPSFG
ncbi:MAG: hypothetical protein V4541_02700 [Bacteroidota bacterium]